jgi:hypothetical protein
MLLRSTAAISLDALGSRLTHQGTVVPRSALVHLTVTRPLGPAYELRMSVGNLFDTIRLDPATPEHVMDAIPQYGRTIAVAVRWTSPRR